MRFLPLLELQLIHTYYADHFCPDFDIEPTAETRQLLANYRCTLKRLRSGIRIFAQVTDASEQFIKMPSDRRLTFYLRLRNPDFALFTDLTDMLKDGIPLLTNNGLGAGDPVKLTWQSRQEWTTGNVWAEVEILNNGSLPPIAQGPGQFQVTFSSRPARWIYYVILNSASAEPTIAVAGTTDIAFSMTNRTNLKEQPDPTDDIAQQLAAQYPGRQRWRFVSNGEIPCQEAARKSIQLQIDGSPVIAALPNPAPRTSSKGFKVNGTSILNPLYQVVTYFSN